MPVVRRVNKFNPNAPVPISSARLLPVRSHSYSNANPIKDSRQM